MKLSGIGRIASPTAWGCRMTVGMTESGRQRLEARWAGHLRRLRGVEERPGCPAPDENATACDNSARMVFYGVLCGRVAVARQGR